MEVEKVRQWSKLDKLRLLNAIDESDEYNEEHLKVLGVLLEDDDPEVRAGAAMVIWNYPEVQFIDKLFDLALNDPSQEVRSQAIKTLGRYIYEGLSNEYELFSTSEAADVFVPELPLEDFLRVKNFLINVFHNESLPLESRRCAVEALGFLSEPEVVEVIEKAYQHPDIQMKVSAIFAMGRSGLEKWEPIILRELQSEVYDIRYEAVKAAGEAVIENAVPYLIKIALSQEEDKSLRLEAIWSLGLIGGEEAGKVLKSLREDPDPDVREVAEAAWEECEIYKPIEDEWIDALLEEFEEEE
jgi:HEAT repeat protein